MRQLVVGVHLHAEDIGTLANAVRLRDVFLSGYEISDDQTLGDRDLVVRVSELRARLLDRATFIAVRYGFTFRNVTEAESKCGSNASHWQQVLESNRGNVEMTMKVAASGGKEPPDKAQFESGAAYLKALHASAVSGRVAPEFKSASEKMIGGLAIRKQWNHRDHSSAELAVLVPRDSVENVREAALKLKGDFPHVPFMLSGPWPLEVFADADHE